MSTETPTNEPGQGAGRTNGPVAPSGVQTAHLRETRLGWLVLAAVWTICAAYLWWRLRDAWIPYDAGALSYMAERVLRGQIPFRDFAEVYTGGLTYLNALAFRLLGANFFSLRIPLFLFFLGWVPSVYFIARRFVRPLAAGAVTLLAVAWSVPNYPEAMPSWYNLFFATWGVLALLRYVETERRRWLWIAGLAAGMSFLFKITALYFVVAGLLFLVFRQLSLSRIEPGGRRSGLSYRIFATFGLAAFLAALTALISERPMVNEYFQFVLPLGCLVAFLMWETWTRASTDSAGTRFRRLFGMLAPFLAGALIPVGLFAAWIAAHGALGAWIFGVFVRPAMVTEWGAYSALAPAGILCLLPAGLVLFLAFDPSPPARKLARYLVPPSLLCMLLASWRVLGVYALFGFSPPFLVPVVAVAAALRLSRSGGQDTSRQQGVFLISAAAVACALIQFPYSVAIYFEFAAPLVLLALVALLPSTRRGESVALGSLLAFYLLFALWLHTPGFYIGIHVPTRQPFRLETLSLPGAGGIRGEAGLVSEYDALIPVIREHARGGYIFALPDVPEVYFLSGLQNPTGEVMDDLDPDFLDPLEREQNTLAALREHGVNAVVLGPADSSLSGPIPPALRALLDERFPESEKVGDFEVRWRH